MKKLLLTTILIVIALFTFTACKPESKPLVISESDEFVVINCETDQNDLTLAEYMNGLSDIFVIENGMVIAINNLQNAPDWSFVWMLYTDDSELSNTAWGTIEYNGKIYASAVLGAETLTVKNGKTYIWVYKAF